MFKQNDQISSLLLEAISEAVVVVDNHQKIVEINASAEAIFGYSKEEQRYYIPFSVAFFWLFLRFFA